MSCTYQAYLVWRQIIVTLKYGSNVTQDHWKWYHSKAWVTNNYGRILYPFWDITRYWSNIAVFWYPPCIRRPPLRGSPSEYWIYWAMSTEYRRVTNRQTDDQTDGRSSCRSMIRAMHTRRAVKVNSGMCLSCISTAQLCTARPSHVRRRPSVRPSVTSFVKTATQRVRYRNKKLCVIFR